MLAFPLSSWLESLPRLFGLALEDEDEPRYDVLASDGGVELRRYASALFAEVDRVGDEDVVIGEGLELLARYALGANAPRPEWPDGRSAASGARLPLTTPLVHRRVGDGWIVSLFLGNDMTEIEVPAPTDPRVRLSVSPERVVAVLGFRGHEDRAHRARARVRLEGWLRAHGEWGARGEVAWAQYDARSRLPFLDHNEAHLELASRAPRAQPAGTGPSIFARRWAMFRLSSPPR